MGSCEFRAKVTMPVGPCCRWRCTRRARARRRSATSPSAPAIPQPYLEQILLALKGAGLVRSKRGVGGGYVLARSPAEIRLSEILAAVDGPIRLGDFGEPHQDGACDHEGQCVLLAIWKLAGEHMRQLLEGFTLASQVADAARGVPQPLARGPARPEPRLWCVARAAEAVAGTVVRGRAGSVGTGERQSVVAGARDGDEARSSAACRNGPRRAIDGA